MITPSKKYLRAMAFSVAIPVVAVGAGFGVGIVVARCTERIEDQQQLEKVVEEERKGMNLPPHYQIYIKTKTTA